MMLLNCLEKLKKIYPEIIIGDFNEQMLEMLSTLTIDEAITSEKADLGILSGSNPARFKAWNSIEFSLAETEAEFDDGCRYKFIIFMHDVEDGEEVKIPYYVEDGHHSSPLTDDVVPYNLENEFICLEIEDETYAD